MLRHTERCVRMGEANMKVQLFGVQALLIHARLLKGWALEGTVPPG